MPLTEYEQAELKGRHDHRIETYKSMITISVEVFKYLALLNGGAAAGMVATLDKLAKLLDGWALKAAVGLFVAGLFFDGVAMFCSYFTQNTLYGQSTHRPNVGSHESCLITAIVFAILSLLAFGLGAVIAVFGIKS
ncbi:hypothetical protein [Massilia sp. YIM B04103]|uniref:hypothetical protein n=1 Tax=Massilia sp. YIM B04103 TaxID=2963106 RepID=UPI00210B4883|nr:hypothetical protein [Massilia sp. YIM B04103]